MKNFLIDTVICAIGAIFFYPIIALVLFLFHRENDVSGFSIYMSALAASFIWMQHQNETKS